MSGHRSSHAPQQMQFSGWDQHALSPSPPVRAPLGQKAMHMPQPLHQSRLISTMHFFFLGLFGFCFVIGKSLARPDGKSSGVQSVASITLQGKRVKAMSNSRISNRRTVSRYSGSFVMTGLEGPARTTMRGHPEENWIPASAGMTGCGYL